MQKSFSLSKNPFFQNNFKTIFFSKKFSFRTGWKNNFSKKFKNDSKIFLNIFCKKTSLWKNVFKKISEKCFCQKKIFPFGNPFWPIFGTNSGQKILFENVFKKIPKNLFFQNNLKNYLLIISKKIPKILFSKKYYFKNFQKSFLLNKTFFQNWNFNKNSKTFQCNNISTLFSKTTFFTKIWNSF
jgi:hypothetical protein